jgi:threonine dehydrogenase-like Zn-dependent dehydrogenase
MEWPEGAMDFELPFTLGHENAGWIEALGAGADETLEPGEGAAEAILELTGGLGAELVLDMVGADEALALGAQVARFGSQVTMVPENRR